MSKTGVPGRGPVTDVASHYVNGTKPGSNGGSAHALVDQRLMCACVPTTHTIPRAVFCRDLDANAIEFVEDTSV